MTGQMPAIRSGRSAPPAGAIDGGGLELRFVDVGKCGEQQQEHERGPLQTSAAMIAG